MGQKKGKSGLEQPERQPNRKNIDPNPQTTFLSVLSHCILIIASPIATFFGSKFFVFDTLDLTQVQSNIWAAVFAVITLHLALALFLYRAYFETETVKSTRKQD